MRYTLNPFIYYLPALTFTLISLGLYENGLKRIELDYSKLSMQKKLLEQQILQELQIKKKLTHHINSESDPSWIELVLMHKLGLVPENQIKVFFNNHE